MSLLDAKIIHLMFILMELLLKVIIYMAFLNKTMVMFMLLPMAGSLDIFQTYGITIMR